MDIETDGQEAGAGDEGVVDAAETPEVETPSDATTDQPAETETSESPDAGAEHDKPKQVPWFQKRIDEVTRQKYEAQREADFLRGQLSAFQKPDSTVSQPAGQPKEEDFTDWNEYQAALIDYKVNERLQSARALETREKAAQTFQQRVDAVRDKLPDYDIYVGDPTLTITPLMAEVIKESEVGPEVAYHLGKNRSEAQRIANLPPVRQAAELGRLEATLTTQAAAAPPPPAPRNPPPPPPKTVSGLSAGLTKSPDDMSMSEYVEWMKTRDK